MKMLPPEEYYKSLPKKQMGSGVLLFNKNKEMLIVKPIYKDKWTIPGGVVDKDESPRECVIREAKEEIGLDIKNLKFICVDYKKTKDYHLENLQFMFYGGILSDEQVKSIKLAKDELSEFRFISPQDTSLMRPNLIKRLPRCLEGIKNNKGIYLEEAEAI